MAPRTTTAPTISSARSSPGTNNRMRGVVRRLLWITPIIAGASLRASAARGWPAAWGPPASDGTPAPAPPARGGPARREWSPGGWTPRDREVGSRWPPSVGSSGAGERARATPAWSVHLRRRRRLAWPVDRPGVLGREPLQHLLTLAVGDQQQDVDAIPDDPRVPHREDGRREGDHVLEDVLDGRPERLLEPGVIVEARRRDRGGDLGDVGRRGVRECRNGKADERRQQSLHA